ncbi:hypothetical protein B0H10DRAFT_1969917 [Mycena sp. CBHHK59/15]|nr:hypothetical protein B0H10DRAFT_1969917 [Mycena sp. CBHHK59/15]
MSRKLTPAQKSAATCAAKIEKQRQEDIAFITANIWNESSTSHKRTSSTAQASEITKKARETAPVPERDQEDDEPEEPEVPVKSTSRRHEVSPECGKRAMSRRSHGSEPQASREKDKRKSKR